MYSNTLWEIRHYLATMVGDLLYGVCGTTGATTTKIYAGFLWQADDYYNEHHYDVYVYLGTNKGLNRRVTDWVLADFLLTVHSAYAAACDATSYIELHRIFTEDELRKAINLAIESSADQYLVDKVDASITLVADTYEYTLPEGFEYVHGVTTEDTADTGKFYQSAEIDHRDWDIISQRTLRLRRGRYSITAGKDLQIEGQGRQATVDDDVDVIELPPDWLVQKAITLLPQAKIQNNALDDTYKQALLLSSRTPTRPRHPRARRVLK